MLNLIPAGSQKAGRNTGFFFVYQLFNIFTAIFKKHTKSENIPLFTRFVIQMRYFFFKM